MKRAPACALAVAGLTASAPSSASLASSSYSPSSSVSSNAGNVDEPLALGRGDKS